MFENRNLEKKFKEIKIKKKILTSTLYTRFFYPNLDIENNSQNNLKDKKFTLGILGSIDPIRKDYEIIADFVRDNKDKIQIIFLGKFLPNLSEKVIKIFDGCKIIYKDFLQEEELQDMGLSCDLLLSLNKEEKFYGDYKGTGSFGDALFLQKPLIAPQFSDKIREFEDFVIYYNDKKELENLLSSLMEKKFIKKINFDKFSIDQCRNQILNDLEIKF